jgi:hypothetical protein
MSLPVRTQHTVSKLNFTTFTSGHHMSRFLRRLVLSQYLLCLHTLTVNRTRSTLVQNYSINHHSVNVRSQTRVSLLTNMFKKNSSILMFSSMKPSHSFLKCLIGHSLLSPAGESPSHLVRPPALNIQLISPSPYESWVFLEHPSSDGKVEVIVLKVSIRLLA